MKKVFKACGTFGAVSKANKWCKSQGYSIGSMARDMPIGLKKGKYVIAKWYNLSEEDISFLDGRMESADFREGSVTVTIK